MRPATRRYLLRPQIHTWLQERRSTRVKYLCYFTEIALCKEREYCKKRKKYFRISREGIGEKQKSRIERIDRETFQKEKKNIIGQEIRKNRHHLSLGEIPLTIDRYKRALKGIAILELPETTPLPEPLRPYLLEEVTRDPRYLEKHLALFGNPSDTRYNVYALFREIERTLPKRTDTLLFSRMRTIDAVRIVLYGYYSRMLSHRENYLREGRKQDFELFRSYTGKSLALLRHFPKLFEKSLYQKALLHLMHLREATTPLRDLYLIQKQLKASESLFEPEEYFTFEKRLEEKIAQIGHDLAHYLGTRECAIILKQYEMMLKEGTRSRYQDDNSVPISHIVTRKLAEEMKRIQTLEKEIDGCQDEVSYRRLRKALKKADVLLYAFGALLEKRWLDLHRTLHTLLQKLKAYENLSRKSLIVATYLQHAAIPSKKSRRMIDRTYAKNAKRELALSKEIDALTKRLLERYQRES